MLGNVIGRFSARQFESTIIQGIVLINILFAALAVIFLIHSRGYYLQNVNASSDNLVQLLEQNVTEKSRLIDDALQRIQRELEQQLKTGGINEGRLLQLLSSEQAQLPEVEGIRVSNAQGDVVWGKGVSPENKSSYADRQFFQKLASGATGLIVTEVITGRISGKPVIVFARSYKHAGDTFAGAISAAVAVESFTTLLASVQLGSQDTVVLRSADMGLIARYPPMDSWNGAYGNKKVGQEYAALVESGVQQGSFHTHNSPDGVERTYSYRRVVGWPATLTVGLADEQYLKPWYSQIIWVACCVLIFFVITSAFSWLTIYYLRERTALLHSYLAEIRRRRILVEQSQDGIVVLDQQGKVWEANLRFAEMLGYSLEEVHELHVWDWDAQWTREQLLVMIEHCDASGAFLETYHQRKDGTRIAVEISSNGVNLDNSKMVFCVCRDVTARNHAAEELKQRNAELEMFNQASIGRELNMIKLKRQINALLTELGRKPLYDLAFTDDEDGFPSERRSQ